MYVHVYLQLLNSKLKETEDELHCKTIAVSELERKMEELRQIISSKYNYYTECEL